MSHCFISIHILLNKLIYKMCDVCTMRNMKRVAASALLFFAWVLTGCHVGPEYHPPWNAAPEKWKYDSEDHNNEFFSDVWWEVYRDPVLNELEQQAIMNNPTVIGALERIMQARAQAGIVGADLYPQITVNPSYSSIGILVKNFLGNRTGSGTVLNPLCPPPFCLQQNQLPPVFRQHQLQNLLPLNLSYEVDLWGKLRDRYDSAVYNEQAVEWDYQQTLLVLTTDLATAYFLMRLYDAQIDLYLETIKAYQKAYDITLARYKGKVINYSDVSRAAFQLSNAKQDYYEAVRNRAVQENQIAALVGQPAPIFCLEHSPLVEEPPKVPAGIPSDVLYYRPDILSLERTMASQHALMSAAFAEFFPSLTLTGAIGYSSPDSEHFLKWISRYWSIGASVAQTVFDGGRLVSNLELARARFGEAGANYYERVLVAFEEVENALAGIKFYANQQDWLVESIKAAETTVNIATDRYKMGVAIFLEVTTAQQDELTAKRAYNAVLAFRYLSTVQLIKALGANWCGDSCECCGS